MLVRLLGKSLWRQKSRTLLVLLSVGTAATLISAFLGIAFTVTEQMARELRTGKNFILPAGNEIKFTNSSNQIIYYRLNNNAIERGVGDAPGTIYNKITADTIRIVNFKIQLLGDVWYPARITIGLSVGSTSKHIENILTNIQTTVSSRSL